MIEREIDFWCENGIEIKDDWGKSKRKWKYKFEEEVNGTLDEKQRKGN